MSELDATTLRRELLLQQGIDEQLDGIVRLATSVVLKLPHTTQMEESQLRNLLNASLETKSVEVTANFIRYQIARKERDWDLSLHGFGHSIIQHIVKDMKELAADTISTLTTKLLESTKKPPSTIQEDGGSQPDRNRQEEIEADIAWLNTRISDSHVRLMQLYLGYVNRVFYFYKKSIDHSKRDPKSTALADALTSLQLVAQPQVTEGKADGS